MLWRLSIKLTQWCKQLTKLDNQTFCPEATGMFTSWHNVDGLHLSTHSSHFLLSPLIISNSFYLSPVPSFLYPFLPPSPLHLNSLIIIAQNMTLRGNNGTYQPRYVVPYGDVLTHTLTHTHIYIHTRFLYCVTPRFILGPHSHWILTL